MNELGRPARDMGIAKPNGIGEPGADPREEGLYEIIVAAVLGRRLRAGERLNEQMLSEAHGISRTRVRRVLVRLQHENIVRFEHNRGAFICRPTVKEAHDLFDVRRFLEESVVRTLLRQRREGAPADPLFKAARDGAGDSPMQGLSDNFALRLAEATGNGVLVELLAGILRRCALLQAVYGATARKEPSESERIELVERIGKGDERGAIALLNQRLDRLVAELDLAKESGAPDIYARQ